jgi:hypothetical protein
MAMPGHSVVGSSLLGVTDEGGILKLSVTEHISERILYNSTKTS